MEWTTKEILVYREKPYKCPIDVTLAVIEDIGSLALGTGNHTLF